MSYITKIVASVVVLAIGAMPLLASIPCCQSALSTGCCGPVCPMMTKARLHKAKDTKGTPEAQRCTVCLAVNSPVAIEGKTSASPNLNALRNNFIDPQPGLVIIRAVYAPPRGEQLPHPPRESLCIFLI